MKSEDAINVNTWPHNTSFYFLLFDGVEGALERKYFYSILVTWMAINAGVCAVAYFLPQPLQPVAIAMRLIAIITDITAVICLFVPSQALEEDKFVSIPGTEQEEYTGSDVERLILIVVGAFFLTMSWPIFKWEEHQGR